MFGQGAQTTLLSQLGFGGGQQAFCLIAVERRGEAGIDAGLHQFEAFLAGLYCFGRDHELGIVGPQGEIGVGDQPGNAEANRVTRILAGQQGGTGSLVGTADAAPDIEFERGAQADAARLAYPRLGRDKSRRPGARLGVADAGGAIDLREERSAGFTGQRIGLLDAGDGQAQAGIAGQCLIHEIVQGRIIEQRPPVRVDGWIGRHGDVFRRLRLTEDGRQQGSGAQVVRTNGAAAQGEREGKRRQADDGAGNHAFSSSFVSRCEGSICLPRSSHLKKSGMNSVAMKVAASMPPKTPVPID